MKNVVTLIIRVIIKLLRAQRELLIQFFEANYAIKTSPFAYVVNAATAN